MSEQPDALRLADMLERMPLGKCDEQAAAELRRLHQSEREGWRYATELEQERKRLQSEVDRLTQHILDQNRELDDELIPMAEKLETQRDELLEALMLASTMLGSGMPEYDAMDVKEIVDTAIAKAERQA